MTQGPRAADHSRDCPRCGQLLTNVGAFWICPQHGQITDAQESSPLRIFLSYGHDANEALVRRIRADLEARGHDVWFDQNEIKCGHDWRRSITDGIVASDRVLSFLSKHSTRHPGVCLEEIAIAIGARGGNIQTVLVEGEQEVRPPASISHIQWLDMHDWKERHAAGGTAWDEWYQAKLAEIVAVVESEESRRFAGEIEQLEEHLTPILSDSRIGQLLKKDFVGRVCRRSGISGFVSRRNTRRSRGSERSIRSGGSPWTTASATASWMSAIALTFVSWFRWKTRGAGSSW